jgi:hypothetical protein
MQVTATGDVQAPKQDSYFAHPAERLAALVDEHVSPLDPVSLLLPVQEVETVHLIPLKVIYAVGAALEPADDDGLLRQVDVIPAEIASLWTPAGRDPSVSDLGLLAFQSARVYLKGHTVRYFRVRRRQGAPLP